MNPTYFQVIPPDINFLIFVNLTVPKLFDLCQTPSFNSFLCSKYYFWDHYYFSRFDKRFNPSNEYSTSKNFFIKVNEDYQSNMKDETSDGGLGMMAFYGLEEELNDFLEKGADNYNGAMESAARGGQMEIVKLMIEKGANDYNETMRWAARGGYMEIVKLMIEKGADNYNWAMRNAAWGGHMEIVKLIESYKNR